MGIHDMDEEDMDEEVNKEIRDGIIIDTKAGKVTITFKDEDKRNTIWEELQEILRELPRKTGDYWQFTTHEYKCMFRCSTKSQKRREIWFSKITEFFKGKYPDQVEVST